MTSEQKEECHKIIHVAAASGAGIAAAAAQLPGSDNVALVALEIGMTIKLGAIFNVNINESFAKSIVASTAGTLVGRGVSQFLVGWIPGLGNAINASTAAGVIETLGWALASDFDKGKYSNF